MTKEQIIEKYNRTRTTIDMASYNKQMYPEFSVENIKMDKCRYFLFPAYIEITDFTAEEMYNNFYVGDIMELTVMEWDSPEAYFGKDWNPETGNGKWD